MQDVDIFAPTDWYLRHHDQGDLWFVYSQPHVMDDGVDTAHLFDDLPSLVLFGQGNSFSGPSYCIKQRLEVVLCEKQKGKMWLFVAAQREKQQFVFLTRWKFFVKLVRGNCTMRLHRVTWQLKHAAPLLTQMKDDCNTNSRYLTYAFSL